MPADENPAPAEKEQIDVLEDLVKQARAKGIRTGIRNDEIEDLSQAEAADLIEQLQQRLGQARG